MTFDEFQVFARAFADQPEVMAAFIAACKAKGIAMPTDDDTVDADDVPITQAPRRYAPPNAAQGSQTARSRFLSSEGRKAFAPRDLGPLGPRVNANGNLEIRVCCPSEYRRGR
jgi:hypothetical protein